MYELYDRKSSLLFPNGETYTPEQLQEMNFYKLMFEKVCVVDVVDGVVKSFDQLSRIKTAYGVVNDDDAAAVEECNAIRQANAEKAKKDQATLEAVDAKADENTQAIAELGVMTAEGQTTNADLLQAVGELGVQVAELSAKIEQLQTPTA